MLYGKQKGMMEVQKKKKKKKKQWAMYVFIWQEQIRGMLERVLSYIPLYKVHLWCERWKQQNVMVVEDFFLEASVI
jgi:hypothetical protein